ncbi:methylmalonyl Co-A mutase-associated GTPase MeaB [Zhouia sp. PK063]|uniref:methylmalonyl Co-A mutase-associated GTPase MeaB n=1 Tax=Zhouia sp. PK063 TaxID=3373602 RepID=UPI00378E27B6
MNQNNIYSFNKIDASAFKKAHQNMYNSKEIILGIQQKNTTALAKAITIIESELDKHALMAEEILTACMPISGNSIRIGITGAPGVGKSTFIEAFGNYLIQQKYKVAVLAVDPSSSLSKGSILGDKTRMETLAKNNNVFIRPSASNNSLGGISSKTYENIILCEATGFDIILIETVGVGQSEIEVYNITDFFLVLQLPNAGDELQGIKRGIIELADAIVINKADGEFINTANQSKIAFRNALQLFGCKENGWQPKTLTASALQQNGIQEVWQTIQEFVQQTKNNSSFHEKRIQQQEDLFFKRLKTEIQKQFFKQNTHNKNITQQLLRFKNKEVSLNKAIQSILSKP